MLQGTVRVRWLAALICIFAVIGCRSTPEPVSISLSRTGTVFARAVDEAAALTEPVQQVTILATIAGGMLQAGHVNDAISVAREAVRLARALTVSPEVVRLRLTLAETLLQLDETADARALIGDATAYARNLLDEAARAGLLVRIVESALTSADDTRDLLPAVVDEVYVIENTALRAATLISVALAYQRVGVGQSVTGLINQAIPAIRSVADPQERASLFARLSFRALDAADMDLALELVDDAMDQLPGAGQGVQKDTVTVIARALSATQQVERASQFVRGVAGSASRARGYLAIAGELLPARAATEYLDNALQAAETIEQAAEYVSVMVDIAAEYQRRSLSGAAARLAGYAAARARQAPGFASQLDILKGLVRVYAAADRLEELRSFVADIGDPYVRSVLYVSVADQLVQDGRQGIGDDFLVEALLEADETEFLSDSLRLDIAVGFAETGNYSLSIRTIERMSDRAMRAEAVARLGYYAEPPGGLSASQMELLDAVLGR